MSINRTENQHYNERCPMAGEENLDRIIRQLSPQLLPSIYVFCSLKEAHYGDYAHTQPLASVAEKEGLTLVITKDNADQEGLIYQGLFRCISLNVHSSLESVGLTAVVSGALAEQSISANIIAGYYHDHILVPAAKTDLAMQTLRNLIE